MWRALRRSVLGGISTALLLVAGCSSSSTPSTFGSGGGGSEGGATDGASMESGSFGGGGSGNFSCGAATCTRYEYCLFITTSTGTEMSANCYPYGNCGDCGCVMRMVSAAQCAGYTVTCTPQPPFTVSCVPGGTSMDSGAPGDSSAGD